MNDIEYQIWTDGDRFRVRSAMKHRWLFSTWTSYQWESHWPHEKTYEDAAALIQRQFGQSARIAHRVWRQA